MSDHTPKVRKKNSKRLALFAQRKRVQGITKKLYRVQPPDEDTAIYRDMKAQIVALKSTSIKVARLPQSRSYSTIRNISLDLLADLKRPRKRPDMSMTSTDEAFQSFSSLPPKGLPLLPNGQNRLVSNLRKRSSIIDMKTLALQMNPVIIKSEIKIQEEEAKEIKVKMTKSRTMVKMRGISETVSRTEPEVSIEEMKEEMGKINTKLRELDMKIKLQVTSIAILEEDLRLLVSDCMEYKRISLRKRIEAAYKMLRLAKGEKERETAHKLLLKKRMKTDMTDTLPVTPYYLD